MSRGGLRKATGAACVVLAMIAASMGLTTAPSAATDNSNIWFGASLAVTCGNCTANISVLAYASGSGVNAPYQVGVVATDDCSEWYQNNSSSLNSSGFWYSQSKIHVQGSSCSSMFHIGFGKP